MSAWSMGLKLCASKPTQRKGGPSSAVWVTWGLLYVPRETDDGDVDREVKIWTRKAVCEIGCVD